MTIKELRTARKLSQAALAAAIGVNVSAIGHLENGRMKLSEKLAGKIREVYGVEIDREPVSVPAAAKEKAPAKKAAAKPEKKEYANEIVIQSPMGGEITTEQVVAKLPEGVDCVFVRVDQNKLWWIRGEETGNVDIWE